MHKNSLTLTNIEPEFEGKPVVPEYYSESDSELAPE